MGRKEYMGWGAKSENYFVGKTGLSEEELKAIEQFQAGEQYKSKPKKVEFMGTSAGVLHSGPIDMSGEVGVIFDSEAV